MSERAKNLTNCAILFFLLLMPRPVSAGIFSAVNFDGCLLDGMQGLDNDQAAVLVMSDCWRKFPRGPNSTTGNSGFFSFDSFGVNLWSECILEYMAGVGSDRAAQAILGACGRKFRLKSDIGVARNVSPEDRSKIKECVVRNSDGVTSGVASSAISGACRRRVFGG